MRLSTNLRNVVFKKVMAGSLLSAFANEYNNCEILSLLSEFGFGFEEFTSWQIIKSQLRDMHENDLILACMGYCNWVSIML